jgi:hypothetical protein
MQNARYGVMFVLVACGGTDVGDFAYGGGQPGALLAEGGEIRHEHTTLLGTPQTWLAVYRYTGPGAEVNAPFPAPADGGKGVFGNCVDERVAANQTWPFKPITGATYVDLPKVEVTGPGITGVLNVIKTDPPNKSGNSTLRAYDFTYGGGAPGDPDGFNAGMTTPEMSTPGGLYTVDIGIGEPMDFVVPEAYTTPLGVGGAATVNIPAAQDLTLTWDAPANDFGESGVEHNLNTHFNFTFFADPTVGQALFICFPTEEGTQVIPKAVIDALPSDGLIVHSNMTHFMEAREGRRFDLVGIYCNISLYHKQ